MRSSGELIGVRDRNQFCKGGGRGGGGRAGTQFANRPLKEQANIINRMSTNNPRAGMSREVRDSLMNDMLQKAGFQRETAFRREIIINNEKDGEKAIRYLRKAGITGELPRALDPGDYATSQQSYERLNKLYMPKQPKKK